MKTRKGTAMALPAALLAMAVLVPLMIVRHSQGSHTRGNVARTIRGGQLMDLGRAAIAEGWWQLERSSQDPASPLFMQLRAAPAQATPLDLTVPHLSKQLAEDPCLAACKLDRDLVRATLTPLRRTSNRTREGVCDVTLEARLRHDGGLTRVYRETREMRISLLTLPPPFDEPTLMVLDGAQLVGDQTNAWLEEAVSLTTRIALGAKAAGASDIGGEPPAPLVDDLNREVHRFPAKYVVLSRAKQVDDIAALFVRPKFEVLRHELEAMGPPADLAGQAVTDPNGAGQKARRLAQTEVAMLETARAYQKQWDELGGADADSLRALAAQLEPREWRRRAFFAFEGPGAAKALTDLLDRCQAEGRALNGVAYVSDPDLPVKLTRRTIHGRLVVVSTGPVELEEVHLASRATDLLVVQAEGLMSTAGRIEGSLVVRGGVEMRPGTVIAGSLIMKDVRPLDQLGGRIECDTVRTRSTVDGLDRPEMFWVAIAPVAKQRQMEAE